MPQTVTRNCLSAHDQQVLESIFNPLELTSSVAQAISPEGDADLVDSEPDTAAVRQSKALEVQAVKLAEQSQLDEALLCFGKALAAAPERASVYNNRAQALRLAGRDDEAFDDLNKSLELGDRQMKTKCHALCQRGVLNRKRDDVEAARKDFEQAAQMGSNFAKAQLVEINPFAALCNQMLRQAFEQLK